MTATRKARVETSETAETTTTQTVKLDRALLVRLKIHAAMTCTTQQDIIHAALVEYLDKHARPLTATKGATQHKKGPA